MSGAHLLFQLGTEYSLATTWSIDVRDWWTGLEISRWPVNHSGDGWASLGRRLQPFRNGRNRGIFRDLWLTRSDAGKPDFWALYAVLKLKKQKHEKASGTISRRVAARRVPRLPHPPSTSP